MVSFVLEPELLEAVREQAVRHRRSATSIYVEGIEIVVKRLEKKEP